jgi:hypothetical protein
MIRKGVCPAGLFLKNTGVIVLFLYCPDFAALVVPPGRYFWSSGFKITFIRQKANLINAGGNG